MSKSLVRDGRASGTLEGRSTSMGRVGRSRPSFLFMDGMPGCTPRSGRLLPMIPSLVAFPGAFRPDGIRPAGFRIIIVGAAPAPGWLEALPAIDGRCEYTLPYPIGS